MPMQSSSMKRSGMPQKMIQAGEKVPRGKRLSAGEKTTIQDTIFLSFPHYQSFGTVQPFGNLRERKIRAKEPEL